MFVMVFEESQPIEPGLHWVAANRAPRLVDSTMALCVQKKWPPATTATIIIRKNADITANSIVAMPLSEVQVLLRI